jgi:hypothetical protein
MSWLVTLDNIAVGMGTRLLQCYCVSVFIVFQMQEVTSTCLSRIFPCLAAESSNLRVSAHAPQLSLSPSPYFLPKSELIGNFEYTLQSGSVS